MLLSLLSSRVFLLVFVLLVPFVSRPERLCSALTPTSPDGSSHADCRPVDIELYTWLGPSFQSGECWHHGQRFLNGAVWGRTDVPNAPYCVCEQGKVRIFYTQRRPSQPAADPLTILRPFQPSSPTAHDLAKWPIPNIINIRQRSVVCSADRLGMRVRSRDSCTGCKCSKNGHWLCRKPPSLRGNRTRSALQRALTYPRQRTSRRRHYASNSSTSARVRPQCPAGTALQYCILIERIFPSNASERASRYIEVPRGTAWIDQQQCTQCSCTTDGRLTCEFLPARCNRSCLVQKVQPIPITYFFPAGAKWLTPPNDKCRSCVCIDGERRCANCDQIVKIEVETNAVVPAPPHRSAVGEFRLPSAGMIKPAKVKPCVLQLAANSHRLLLPGQRTWFEQRCYVCSKQQSRLLPC